MLNCKQKEIVDSNNKFIYIQAGAGTGKTHTLVSKINRLIDNNISPENIVAITFSDKASYELQNRVKNKNVIIATFHKYILDILKNNYINEFKIFTNENNYFKKIDLIKFSKYKNNMTKIKPFFYNYYMSYLKNNKMIDFDDIFVIFLTSNLNFKKPLYLFIDEFQDTNNLQYKVIKKIIKENKTNVIAVGDNKQAIYGFRGANNKIINRFIKEFNAKVFSLNINYRSDKNIIKLANNIIKNKKNDSLICSKKNNGDILLNNFSNELAEATSIINEIKKLLSLGYKKKEIAVISRNENRLFYVKKLYNSNIKNFSISLDDIFFTTIHKTKGLEFKVVFLIGLEKNNFPSCTNNSLKEYKEEERLLYVAITRCKEKLYISSVKKINNIFYPISKFYNFIKKNI